MRGAYETPQSQCPYCQSMCDADWCDVGVGMQQVGPYYCHDCGASEASAFGKPEERPDYDHETGWYRPGAPIDDLANKDGEGNPIGWQEADTQYRESVGVASRYPNAAQPYLKSEEIQ